jgi:HipA-like C-terminal domain
MNDTASLLAALSNGPLAAGELVARLGVSRPTLSRLVAAAGDAVVRYGAARATCYARSRTLAGLSQLPLHRVAEDGRVSSIGVLRPVAGGYLAELAEHGSIEFSESLPWWLQDMRPQGFLGRAFARQHATTLNLPETLALWNDDHALIALSALGEDTPGNLIVGDAALSRYLAGNDGPIIPRAERSTRYPALAAAAMAGDAAGSSAGGEQPKFSAVLDDGHTQRAVLVKFNGATINPISRRWASLLVAEHLALQSLRAAGLPASDSELIEAGGQTFLQLERFDRVPRSLTPEAPNRPRLGRRALISLAALDDAFVGRADQPWPAISASLGAQGRLSDATQRQIEQLYAFGLMIANSDMHRGNLSFLPAADGALQLAPAYDMLPMHFAPRASGEMSNTAPDLHYRSPPSLAIWQSVLPMVQRYWQAVLDDVRVDEGLRAGAEARLAELARLGVATE